ncbi:MAG: glycosyltransferase involved in cell wall biosynthesis [Planctomycetota bacterium]|jgi:glycosyltransferase involved in cell wall biosynthesis
MRVGLDYRPAIVNREGIGRYARELVRGMIELGFDGNMGLFGYTLARKAFSDEELGIAGARAELLRLRLPSRSLPWILRRLGKGVDDLVGGCDVYHHTQPNLLDVRLASQVVTIFDCIYTIPDSGYLDPAVAAGMTASAKAMIERSSYVLVPCRFVGAEVVMSFGVEPERVMVTPLGCDHVVRHLPPEGFGAADSPYIFTASRIDARKNHLRMLKAFELLVKEGLPHHWVIAGPRGYGSEIFEAELERSPAKDRVRMIGAVGEAELVRWYAQADLFLWASLNEGFGLPPLEAMACGTPVVTSNVTSMPEVCGEAALLVEPTDIERIFEASRRLLTESSLAEEYMLRGKRRAREFTWRECARTTLLAYQAAGEVR